MPLHSARRRCIETLEPPSRPLRAWLALLYLSAISGCTLLDLAGGQLALINDQQPLAAAVARESDPERRRLLQEVPEIVSFAEDVVGLSAGRIYSGYFETEREGLTFVVTACRRTLFEPYTWWFPIVGKVEYRSYWDEADARAAAQALEDAGYDTWISPSRAYSSLGMLRDPITTTMLRDGILGVTEVVIHELSHVKLFVPGHTEWNEALASFVGERGAERYFEQSRFAHSSLRQDMRARAERRVLFDRAVTETYDALQRLYESDVPDARKLALRQDAFDALSARMTALLPPARTRRLGMNNARLVHLHRYGASNELLSELWKESGGNFRRFWTLAERYTRTEL